MLLSKVAEAPSITNTVEKPNTKLNEKLEGLGFLRKLGDVDPRVFDGIKKGLKDFPEPFLEDFLAKMNLNLALYQCTVDR